MSSLMDDRNDDVRLPGRGSERRSTREEASYNEKEADREFTLSTGTVLGMFFALALICAVFFGFGYSMGRKTGQATAEAAAGNAASSESAADVAASKPSPGAPAIQAIPGYMSQAQADAANRNASTQSFKAAATPKSADPTLVVVPTTTPVSSKPARPLVASSAAPAAIAAPIERRPESRQTVPAAVPTSALSAAVASGSTTYVQIAAVSHQEDAEVLISALKRRGYSVVGRPGDSDKLIHVQVGPFATKAAADAMRQRLLGDGYNAIVKQ